MSKADGESEAPKGVPAPESEDELLGEPYLWDRSAPSSADVKKLETLLAPLALRSGKVPLPPERAVDVARAPSQPAGGRRKLTLILGGAAGVLALAAAATLGYFAGQGTRPPTENRAVLSVGTSPHPEASVAEARSAAALSCDSTPPTDGGLAYEVLAGAATCGGSAGPKRGYLPLGMWLETDAVSRIMLEVADIGHVEISPRTRLRILPGKGKEHRLELARGMLHARIDAPPRLFIVETGAGTAVDLGCVYTLEVGDDGVGLLRVARGQVALERAGASVIVHRGEACEMRPGKGPGTPFPSDASAPFRSAVSAWDFDGASLAPVLSAATQRDALGLLGLLGRATTRAERAEVAERLAKLVTPPPSITSEKLLAGDKDALAKYREVIVGAY